MPNVIILDDQEKSRKQLIRRLSCFPEINIVGIVDTIATAYVQIKSLKPDIVFLDIILQNGETSLGLLKKFEKIDFDFIFVSAYADLLKWIGPMVPSGLRCIAKPIDPEKLKMVLSDFKDSKECRNIVFPKNEKRGICIRTSKEHSILRFGDIIYARASASYTYFFLRNGEKIVTSRSLGEYETILPSDFCRSHQSYIVNVGEAIKYFPGKKAMMLLSNGKEVPVSRRKQKEFSEKFRIISERGAGHYYLI